MRVIYYCRISLQSKKCLDFIPSGWTIALRQNGVFQYIAFPSRWFLQNFDRHNAILAWLQFYSWALQIDKPESYKNYYRLFSISLTIIQLNRLSSFSLGGFRWMLFRSGLHTRLVHGTVWLRLLLEQHYVKSETGLVMKGYSDRLNTATYFLISLPLEWHGEQMLWGTRTPFSCIMLCQTFQLPNHKW